MPSTHTLGLHALDNEHLREITAVRLEDFGGHEHIVRVQFKDGTDMSADDVAADIDSDRHVHYVMKPPEGAPAYTAHQATGLPLEVQTRQCPDCGKTVIWA